MPVTVGGQGVVGIALETVIGTYIAPVHYIPILSESLAFMDEKVVRKPIRGLNDPYEVKQGFTHIEGDLVFEVYADAMAYILYAMNASITKAGAGPYNYTAKGATYSTPNKTLSITVVRNGVVFGYVGCIISSLEISMQDNIMTATCSVLGMDEASQTAPTATWPTAGVAGPGEIDIKFDTVARTDCDSFTFSVNDGGEGFYPIRSGGAAGRKAKEIRFGERDVTFSMDVDFETSTEYNVFRQQTTKAIEVLASLASNNIISLKMPKAVMSSYAPVLSGVGDIVRASGVEFFAAYDSATTKAWEVAVTGTVNIT